MAMFISQTASDNEVLDAFTRERLKGLHDREEAAQAQRRLLQDSLVQLREPHHAAPAPASTSHPSFLLGNVPDFPHAAEAGSTKPGLGQLSEAAGKEFWSAMQTAATKPDVASRDDATGRAARVVARDWLEKHGLLKPGHQGVMKEALHEARAQVTFVSREIGTKLGLNPAESSVIGYSLERALEKEGFRVIASHAFEKSADLFRATASSVASAAGLRHMSESTLAKSMNWMATHGVSREVLKDALVKHSGKFSALMEVAEHPQAFERAFHVLSKSDKVLDGVLALSKDSEFRKSIGTLVEGAGENIASFNKGIGAVAIVAGSALRGDSREDIARESFRAGMAVIGGLVGAAAGGGWASVATGWAGAQAGEWVANKVLDAYDRMMGRAQQAPDHQVTKSDALDSSRVLAGKVANRMQDEMKHLAGSNKGANELENTGRELQREYQMTKSLPKL
ncbi:hypothetical protein QZN30_03430 [Burkholderia multivorans]|nr:hypothetical protein [Burkholderia multivorans]